MREDPRRRKIQKHSSGLRSLVYRRYAPESESEVSVAQVYSDLRARSTGNDNTLDVTSPYMYRGDMIPALSSFDAFHGEKDSDRMKTRSATTQQESELRR